MKKISIPKKIIKTEGGHYKDISIKNDLNSNLFSSLGKKIEGINHWNFLYGFVFLFCSFVLLFSTLVDLQIVKGSEFEKRAEENKLRKIKKYPNRGIIFDRNGKKLAENIPVNNISLNISEYDCSNSKNTCSEDENFDLSSLQKTCETLQSLSETYVVQEISENSENEEVFYSLYDKVLGEINKIGDEETVIILYDIPNTLAIDVIAYKDSLKGINLEEGTKRHYSYGEVTGHLLGYVGKATQNEIDSSDYIQVNDIVGKAGIEKQYDKYLLGSAGEYLVEVDSMGRRVNSSEIIEKEVINGKDIYLSIDIDKQIKAYEALKSGMEKSGGDAGAMILQDVKTGEIVAMASYPNYDNNLFIGGISSEEYSKLINDPRKILLNRAVAGQQAPGSIFKTLVLSSALEAGVITKNTKFLSSSNYMLTKSTGFHEYNKASYGWIDLNRALAISSNIYPCETIRSWNIEELVSYLKRFGVGEKTGIDLPGEVKGMLPSPENKEWLANNGSYWLDEDWYEPADSCYSVIGQGITTVTPIQAVNWASVFANGGVLNTPHLAIGSLDETLCNNGENCFEKIEKFEYEPKNISVLSEKSITTMAEGMRGVVTNGISSSLKDARYNIAIKTGTSEAGEKLDNGGYTRSHSWVMGFFPYEEPVYAFSVFMEFGGKSYNAQSAVKDFINSIELE